MLCFIEPNNIYYIYKKLKIIIANGGRPFLNDVFLRKKKFYFPTFFSKLTIFN